MDGSRRKCGAWVCVGGADTYEHGLSGRPGILTDPMEAEAVVWPAAVAGQSSPGLTALMVQSPLQITLAVSAPTNDRLSTRGSHFDTRCMRVCFSCHHSTHLAQFDDD